MLEHLDLFDTRESRVYCCALPVSLFHKTFSGSSTD